MAWSKPMPTKLWQCNGTAPEHSPPDGAESEAEQLLMMYNDNINSNNDNNHNNMDT